MLGLDEFEAIRLIDLEGLQQEQAAQQMGVARTTVQAMYNTARRKLALALVEGKTLRIEGGDVAICEKRALRARRILWTPHLCKTKTGRLSLPVFVGVTAWYSRAG